MPSIKEIAKYAFKDMTRTGSDVALNLGAHSLSLALEFAMLYNNRSALSCAAALIPSLYVIGKSLHTGYRHASNVDPDRPTNPLRTHNIS